MTTSADNAAAAERIAAYYDYDADRLMFEVNRRSFGSFTLTIDGAPDQRDIFWEAFKIASLHERTFKHAEAAE